VSEPSEARDQVVERYRPYLRLLVRVLVRPRLRDEVDDSGLVNQTIAEVLRDWDRFQGWNEQQGEAWLSRCLGNNVKDRLRHLYADCRDVRRKASLQAALDESSARLDRWLQADQTPPAVQAQRREQGARVAAALEQLREDEKEALILQCWHGWTLAEVAAQLGRSPGAVAGLVHRGIKKLKTLLSDEVSP
jgi:RNA polymerase sigma-70 factor (ECF subfamily)